MKCKYCGEEVFALGMCNRCYYRYPAARELAKVLKELRAVFKTPESKEAPV